MNIKKEENKELIDKLFTNIEERTKEREKSYGLSKRTRIRHQNGRILDVILLYLPKNCASISFVDVKTKVEVSTIDIRNPELRYLYLTYEKACEIYDEILKSSEIVEEKEVKK